MSTKAYYPINEIGKGKPGFAKTRSIIEAAFYGNNVVKINSLKEAYDLAKWSISFIKPIGKNEDLLLDVIYILTFVKAACEKNLGLDFSETLFFLKNNIDLCLKKKNNLIEINFYSDEKVRSFSLEKDVIQTLYDEIIFLKDTNIYEDMFYMFNELGGKKNE